MTPVPGPVDARVAALFSSLAQDVYAFAARRCPADVAEDVVSETFVTVLRRQDAIPGPDDEARAWVFAVARNHLAHAQRTRARDGLLGNRLAGVAMVGATVVERDVAARVVEHLAAREALMSLPARDQEILTLVAWERLSAREVALVLGISAEACQSRLRRARERLRQALDDAGAEQTWAFTREEVGHGLA